MKKISQVPHWSPSCSTILKTDSYKASHFYQYPQGVRGLFAYLEARQGAKYPHSMFFGLQYILQRYFNFEDENRISEHDVDEAEAFWTAHGEPFNRDGWMSVVEKHDGRLPLRIRAPKEGTLVPAGMPMVTVESTDPELFWLVTQVETALMRIWYPITVATRSWYCKQVILRHLQNSAEDPASEIAFKLHDFGGRGVSSDESAGVGAMAHLINFMGTDTVEGISTANLHYPSSEYSDEIRDNPFQMLGYSIPAMEHSTVISWGAGGEVEAFRNMLRQSKARGHKLIACVSDSYDLYRCVENIWCGSLLQEVKDSGMRVVVRPDSGDPAAVNTEILRIFARKLGGEMRVNSKGYVVLPDYYRVIQGDGNDDESSMSKVYSAIEGAGFSSSNLGFGMGGGLLQKLDRDTQRMAYKVSAVRMSAPDDDGRVWRHTSKRPATDKSKASKGGRFTLLRWDATHEDDAYTGLGHIDDEVEAPPYFKNDVMETAYEDGRILLCESFADVRKRAGEASL